MKAYLFSYHYKGSKYSLAVDADNQEEAVGRVRRMSSATYDGEIMMSIPAVCGGGVFARLYCFFRNLIN